MRKGFISATIFMYFLSQMLTRDVEKQIFVEVVKGVKVNKREHHILASTFAILIQHRKRGAIFCKIFEEKLSFDKPAFAQMHLQKIVVH